MTPGWVVRILDVISIAFPVIALLLARPFGPLAIVIGITLVLVLRALTGLGRRAPLAMTLAALCAALVLAATSAIDADLAMRLYPVLMSTAMLAVFASSLIHPPSMIERLARIAEPDLPDSAISYTRKVTWVWCAFLAINAAIALWTALTQSLEVWALYNGLISYLLMGCLFGGEFLVRRRLRAAHAGEDA